MIGNHQRFIFIRKSGRDAIGDQKKSLFWQSLAVKNRQRKNTRPRSSRLKPANLVDFAFPQSWFISGEWRHQTPADAGHWNRVFSITANIHRDHDDILVVADSCAVNAAHASSAASRSRRKEPALLPARNAYWFRFQPMRCNTGYERTSFDTCRTPRQPSTWLSTARSLPGLSGLFSRGIALRWAAL